MIDDQSLGDPMKQVLESEANQIYMRLEQLGAGYYVFERNYFELRKLLIAAQSDESHEILWAFGNQDEMLKILREVTRLMLNFLTSAVSLVTYTRNIMRNAYSDSRIMDDYDREIRERFIGNPITGFVEDLRNYSLHFSLPLTGSYIRYTQEEDGEMSVASRIIVLEKSVLLKWKEWTKKGLPYINSADDDIVLLEIADNYYREVMEFHKWLRELLLTVHERELDWLDEMHETIDNIEKRQMVALRRHLRNE